MENVLTYRVKVFTKNAFIIFRGKRIRTPVDCYGVFDHELPLLKLQMSKDALKFSITKESVIKETIIEPLVIEKCDEDVKIEELYDPDIENNSIMDRLLSDEKARK